MRKLIVSMNVTLNGMMAGPQGELDWHEPFWDDEMSRAAALQLGNADTLLFGRVTYQGMAPYWQAQQNAFAPREDVDYSQMMNSYEKIVFSRSMVRIGGWQNARLATKTLATEVKAIKNKPGKDILVYGSGMLVNGLNRYKLVDEYRLWVYPLVLKKGRPLFTSFREKKSMMQSDVKVFKNGVVLVGYRVDSITVP